MADTRLPTKPGDSLFSAEELRAIQALSGWFGEGAEGRVMTVVEDPSIVDYIGIALDALAMLADSETEWKQRGDRAFALEQAIIRHDRAFTQDGGIEEHGECLVCQVLDRA